MTAQFIKASALVVAGALASTYAFAQDEAPEVPAGPTPQEVAAENLNRNGCELSCGKTERLL